jgi:hypothetical protein
MKTTKVRSQFAQFDQIFCFTFSKMKFVPTKKAGQQIFFCSHPV